jgi:hypothetical protein
MDQKKKKTTGLAVAVIMGARWALEKGGISIIPLHV